MTVQRRRFSNTATPTTLNGAITAGATSLVVVSANNYPDAPFSIRIDNEVMLVTAKSGTTFTVTRGYDGTVGAAHSSGADVTHVAIAADFRHQWLDVITVDDSITAYDSEFDQEQIAPSWSEVTPSGTASWTEARGVLSVIYAGQTTSDFAARLTSLNGLSYPLYLTTAIRTFGERNNYQMAGIAFSSGTTTSSPALLHSFYRGAFDYYVQSFRRGTWTNFNTQTERTSTDAAPWLHFRLDWISTNSFKRWWSTDGVSWIDMEESNLSYSLTPTHYGLAVSTWGGSPSRVATFDYFRVHTIKPSYWQEG